VGEAEINRWLSAHSGSSPEVHEGFASTPNSPLPSKVTLPDKVSKITAAVRWLAETYQGRIPAGKTDKILVHEYIASTGLEMSVRTMRRARTGRQ
jgi:hypothetical protein